MPTPQTLITMVELLAAETGLPLADVLDDPPDETGRACSACSGCTERVGIVRRCRDCGGIHGHVSPWFAANVIGVGGEMLNADPDDVTYFDIVVDDHRVHGWYSPSASRVVQYG